MMRIVTEKERCLRLTIGNDDRFFSLTDDDEMHRMSHDDEHLGRKWTLNSMSFRPLRQQADLRQSRRFVTAWIGLLASRSVE